MYGIIIGFSVIVILLGLLLQFIEYLIKRIRKKRNKKADKWINRSEY